MTSSTLHQRQLAGSMLVVLQFSLLSWMTVMAAPKLFHGSLTHLTWLLLLLSVGLGLWTLLYNRLGNFNIHPAPRARGTLVTTGPYRFIRHPMYSAVLLGAAGLCSLSEPVAAWSLWGALLLVLSGKALIEERWLSEQHPQYPAYQKTSKRFVPWLV